MGARKKIMIEGEELPYDQGEWIALDPQGKLVGCSVVDLGNAENPSRVAGEFWGRDAVRKLIEGHRVELINRKRLDAVLREAGWIK